MVECASVNRKQLEVVISLPREVPVAEIEPVLRQQVQKRVSRGRVQVQARVLECLPGKLLTRDQLILLRRDNVVAPGAAGLEALGIAPLAVEQVVPAYLARYRAGAEPTER